MKVLITYSCANQYTHADLSGSVNVSRIMSQPYIAYLSATSNIFISLFVPSTAVITPTIANQI